MYGKKPLSKWQQQQPVFSHMFVLVCAFISNNNNNNYSYYRKSVYRRSEVEKGEAAAVSCRWRQRRYIILHLNIRDGVCVYYILYYYYYYYFMYPVDHQMIHLPCGRLSFSLIAFVRVLLVARIHSAYINGSQRRVATGSRRFVESRWSDSFARNHM